jgi:MFS family permease
LEKRSNRLGLIGATATFAAVFAAAASPIPLYSLYRQVDGLTYSDLSLTAVGYFAGAVTALLVFGRLSNHLGRRPVSLLSLGLAAVGCLILLDVPSAAPLIVGRVLQGLACGLASSATASFIVDNAPANPPWLAAAVSSGAPMIGLTVGALGSGALVEYGPVPRMLPYLAVMAVLFACAALIAASRETVRRSPGALASLRPKLMLPKGARRLFPVAACTFVATWALGGFYQAFGPSMATDQLGSTNALVAAAVFASVMAPSAIGGPLAGRVSPAAAQRIGMVIFCLAVVGILLSLRTGSVLGFLFASACAGAAQGATLTGSIRALLGGAASGDRAGVFSLIYATCYSGAAIPSLIAGQLSRTMSLLQIVTGYGILAALACCITLLAARNPVLRLVDGHASV